MNTTCLPKNAWASLALLCVLRWTYQALVHPPAHAFVTGLTPDQAGDRLRAIRLIPCAFGAHLAPV